MNDVRLATVAPVEFQLGFKDSTPTTQERYVALVICGILVIAAACAALFGREQGPEIKPFVAIAATVWSLADILTAFLLIVQFYVNGSVLFGILGAAYAFCGFMTWAYLAAFPGVMHAALSPGDQQISIFLWTIWHCTFPALVVVATLNERRRQRNLSRSQIRIATLLLVTAPALGAYAISAFVTAYRDSLPPLVSNGHFDPLWHAVFVPAVIVTNAVACIVLLLRRERVTALSVWLSVAMIASILDALLNLGAARFSYAWDTGKVITVVTASVVLVMILCDVVGLYGQLARVARIDDLTALQNRRAFDEHFKMMLLNARRLRGSLAVLFVNIDLFKRFEAKFGRLAGDECLRRVAWELVGCATRPLDLVARYGDEKFAVLLPDMPVDGALVVAERIRCAVESLAISHRGKALGTVTVSVGISYTADGRSARDTTLFEAADRALGDAREHGGNRAVLGNVEAIDDFVPAVAGLGLRAK